MNESGRAPAAAEVLQAAGDRHAVAGGQWREFARFAVFVGGDVGQGGFGDFDDFGLQAVALGVNLDVDGDRGFADFDDIGVKRQQIADEDGVFEQEGVDRDGGDAAVGALGGGQ